MNLDESKPTIDPHPDLKNQVVLRVIAKMLIPYIIMFGLYVIAHGEGGPGGGFQGGVIVASAYVLYCLVYGRDMGIAVLPMRWVEAAMAGGVILYANIGAYGLFKGNAFLDYRALGTDMALAEPLGMSLVETCVGLTVAAAMVTVFNMITERPD